MLYQVSLYAQVKTISKHVLQTNDRVSISIKQRTYRFVSSVIWVVTQRFKEKRCVTTKITAAKETTNNPSKTCLNFFASNMFTLASQP